MTPIESEKKKRRIRVKRASLKPYQTAAFFHPKRYAWIEGTTKAGKTHCAIVWLFEQTVDGKFKNYWWVAPSYVAANIAYTRMLAAIPKWMRKPNAADLTITLPGGKVIWFKSGEKPDNLFGEDVGAVVIDEASRLREAAWHAIRSVVTFTRGKIRAIGNVKGKKNWFYKKCRETQAAMASSTPTDAHWAIITAADAVREGILPQAEIDDAKRELPHDVFMELYYGVPTEDGSNPFGMKFIAAAATLDAPTGRQAVARGLDVARAVDWAVLIGLDAEGSVSDMDRFQKPWEEFYTTVYQGTDVDGAGVLVDSTGIGDVVLNRMQRDRPRRFEGYKFTSESKQKLMLGLAVAIQKGEVRIPKDGPLRMEMENFEFEYTKFGVRYSAPDGLHDDCVMALALAVAARAAGVVKELGRVYPNWGTPNELAALTAYHNSCLQRGEARLVSTLVASDRRPWIMTWFATFPNADVVAIAESPSTPLHASTETPVYTPEEYRATILATEKDMGISAALVSRVGDPDTVGDGPGSIRSLLNKPCAACIAKHPANIVNKFCTHMMAYRLAVVSDPPNHAIVRAAIGDASVGQRPKLYALRDYAPNFCFAMRNVAYHEERNPEQGTGEKIQRRDRGPADTALFVCQSKLDRHDPKPAPARIIPRRKR